MIPPISAKIPPANMSDLGLVIVRNGTFWIIWWVGVFVFRAYKFSPIFMSNKPVKIRAIAIEPGDCKAYANAELSMNDPFYVSAMMHPHDR
jgi:hypothetical protein